MTLHRVSGETGHDGDVVDTGGGQRLELVVEQRSTIHRQQALGGLLAEGLQSRAASGRQQYRVSNWD